MDDKKKPSPQLSEEISVKSTLDQNKKGRSRVNSDPPIQKENISPQGEKNGKIFSVDDYSKTMDKRDKAIEERNSKGKPAKLKTQQKASLGKLGLKAKVIVGFGTLALENADKIIELGKDAYEYFTEDDKGKQIEQEQPKLEEVPKPPSLGEEVDKTSSLTNEQVEDIKMTMGEFQDNRPPFLEDLGQGKEAETPSMEAEEQNIDLESEDNLQLAMNELSDTEKEEIMAGMEDFEEKTPDFLKEELEEIKDIEDPDMDFDIGDISGDDGSDGGSDGGGDGGGD